MPVCTLEGEVKSSLGADTGLMGKAEPIRFQLGKGNRPHLCVDNRGLKLSQDHVQMSSDCIPLFLH